MDPAPKSQAARRRDTMAKFEPWRLLLKGISRLLDAEEPRAARRVRAKLARHGLLDLVPSVRWVDGRPELHVAHELNGLTFTADGVLSNPGWLKRFRRFAEDDRPVALRGRRREARDLPLRLVIAYYGARWKLDTATRPGPHLRGEALEDRAVALVADHYELALESARSMIKRTRSTMPRSSATGSRRRLVSFAGK